LAALTLHKPSSFKFVDHGHDITFADEQFIADGLLVEGPEVVKHIQGAELGIAQSAGGLVPVDAGLYGACGSQQPDIGAEYLNFFLGSCVMCFHKLVLYRTV
jgi:hypothetical protein